MFTQDSIVTPVGVTRRVAAIKGPIKSVSRRLKNGSLALNDSEDDVNSMHRAMNSVLLVAQFFALCPVQGITSSRPADLRFRWRSFRVIYTIIVILAFMVSLGFTISWYLIVGFTFKTSGSLVFYLTGTLCCCMFLKMATKWPGLALLWHQTERSQMHYGYPDHLRFKIRTMAAIIATVAFCEYLLSHANSLYRASQCASSTADLIKRYFIVSHRHVFGVVRFSYGMAVFTALCNFIGAFYWSFANLFVMIISVALASRFRLLNKSLKQVHGKVMSQNFWRSTREDYNALSFLTSNVDKCVSSIILLCFATNLFFICEQLLNMSYSASAVQNTYFYVSFSYLIIRTVAMALYAASVYDDSRVAKDVLYSVPAHNYQIEIHRFLVQVATDNISLTGLNFFPVTRTVLLTLAGTIVTYEVVLVQFGTTSDNSSSNMTELCLYLTRSQF
ncbi:gustatory receptor for sugar taste 64f-like [Periplaneta americana]|uniref:gustatory receptor for sugar taste 64f-like n=1 Tax=Periplaneta americana TaxID=6978 RepID=UPI0037E76621